jgi:secreted trypsin-like serine protease
MKKLSILATLVLILAASALPAAAIVGGVPDGDGHPYVGLMIAGDDSGGRWRCSGTLIAENVFLTAGHCVDGATYARVWFASDFADVPDYPQGGEVAIEGTPIPHPDYNWADADPHDVGLVILDEAVDIEPAMLPDRDDPDLLAQLKKDRVLREGGPQGAYFTVVGYGGSLAEWPPPDLYYELVRQMAEGEYVALTPVWLHLSQKAVFDEGGTCFGDSGGPSFWVDLESGDEIVVAVTSTGDAQCVATGLNYRVDTAATLGWIYDVMDDIGQ